MISSLTDPTLKQAGFAETMTFNGRRLKVLFLTVGLGIGGTERQIVELASRLDRRRFDVTVCVLKAVEALVPELKASGVRVITLHGLGTWDLRVPYRLIRLIRKERPDIVHAFLFWANLAARVLGKLKAVPIVITSYRGMVMSPRWLRGALRLSNRWTHATTCSSEAIRQTVLKNLHLAPESLFTIHNGVDVARFESAEAADRATVGVREGIPVVGTIGRLAPQKGLEVLLQAAVRLRQRALAFQIVVIGGGTSLKDLQRLREDLRLGTSVIFAGPRSDIPALVQLLDLFVMPSLSEGFGISILEAMAAGKPVVASRVGGIPEIVRHGETGLLVAPGDPEALADAIYDLLHDGDRAARMGQLGRQRARETFDISTAVRRHEALYEHLWTGHLGSVKREANPRTVKAPL